MVTDLEELFARRDKLFRAWMRVTIASPVFLALGLAFAHDLALAIGLGCAALSVVYRVAHQRLLRRLRSLAGDAPALGDLRRSIARRNIVVLAIASGLCFASGWWYWTDDELAPPFVRPLAVAFFAFAAYFAVLAGRILSRREAGR